MSTIEELRRKKEESEAAQGSEETQRQRAGAEWRAHQEAQVAQFRDELDKADAFYNESDLPGLIAEFQQLVRYLPGFNGGPEGVDGGKPYHADIIHKQTKGDYISRPSFDTAAAYYWRGKWGTEIWRGVHPRIESERIESWTAPLEISPTSRFRFEAWRIEGNDAPVYIPKEGFLSKISREAQFVFPHVDFRRFINVPTPKHSSSWKGFVIEVNHLGQLIGHGASRTQHEPNVWVRNRGVQEQILEQLYTNPFGVIYSYVEPPSSTPNDGYYRPDGGAIGGT